jgi:hypothetical protein
MEILGGSTSVRVGTLVFGPRNRKPVETELVI